MKSDYQGAIAKRYRYVAHDQPLRHLDDFAAVYNFARRVKILNGLTPFEFICKRWTIEPERFTLNPLQKMLGLTWSGEELVKLEAMKARPT